MREDNKAQITLSQEKVKLDMLLDLLNNNQPFKFEADRDRKLQELIAILLLRTTSTDEAYENHIRKRKPPSK